MSAMYSNQTLLSLKEGDVVHIKEFDDLPKSRMRVLEVIDDAVTGMVLFEGDEMEEYGELYADDFKMVYHIEINM
jgi:hypothetical protein